MLPKVKPIYLLTLAWMVFLAGCKLEPASKLLWPDLSDPYFQLTKKWTKRGVIYSGIDTEIEVYATLKSPEWRKAYVHKWAKVYSLSQNEEKKLQADELKAAQKETEIFLAMYSNKPEQAELKLNSPLWSVFLEIEDKKIYPLEIRPLDWPYAKLKTFFPFVHKWQKSYMLRFRKLEPLQTGPSGNPIRLTLSGPVGKVSLEW